jgi:hypothetical protein
MENKILSKEELLIIANKYTDQIAQVLKAKKYRHLYGNTYDFIYKNYEGKKFAEKLYKHIYGNKYCKQCQTILTSKHFRSFFGGYKEEFCSKNCACKHPQRMENVKLTKEKLYGDKNWNNKEKQRDTMYKKYGVNHNWEINSPFREDCYITNEKLHGNRYWNNLEKSRKTCLEKYNVDSYSKTKDFKERLKKTCIERYGVDYYCETDAFKEKSKQTSLKKYGVEYPQQSPIFNNVSYKTWKKYTLPSGKIINLQGYEPSALNILLKDFEEDEIITQKINMPKIWYFIDNVKHRYFPDIYLPKYNKIIEVKSRYIFNLNKEKDLAKHEKTKQDGYIHEIWIINKEKIEEIIN